jgi:hypothetical protein
LTNGVASTSTLMSACVSKQDKIDVKLPSLRYPIAPASTTLKGI